MFTEIDKITVNSTWNLVSQRQGKKEKIMNIWERSLPFKVSFLLWRLCLVRIPIGKILVRMRIFDNVKCCCCAGVNETYDHLFIPCLGSNNIWKLFAETAGLQGPLVQLKQVSDMW